MSSIHIKICVQSFSIQLESDGVAAILDLHDDNNLFTLNLMNFYYRELSHQNWETDRSRGADHKNIDI